jgi:hypothetical protein
MRLFTPESATIEAWTRNGVIFVYINIMKKSYIYIRSSVLQIEGRLCPYRSGWKRGREFGQYKKLDQS